jgi:hypothetical protein
LLIGFICRYSVRPLISRRGAPHIASDIPIDIEGFDHPRVGAVPDLSAPGALRHCRWTPVMSYCTASTILQL